MYYTASAVAPTYAPRTEARQEQNSRHARMVVLPNSRPYLSTLAVANLEALFCHISATSDVAQNPSIEGSNVEKLKIVVTRSLYRQAIMGKAIHTQ